MTLDQAISLLHANGWVLETRAGDVAILTYEDRGAFTQLLDDRRARSARISVSHHEGRISTRLLSKATTDVLHWVRYRRARKLIQEAQS